MRALKIGGPHYNCYVESDGDQSNGFNGVNLEGGDPAQPRDTAQLGLWRTEIEPTEPGLSTRFLNVLLPRLEGDTRPLPAVELATTTSGGYAARVGDTIVVVAQNAKPLEEVAVTTKTPARFILVDAVSGGVYDIAGRKVTATKEGVLSGRLPKGSHRIRLAQAKAAK